MSDPVVTATPVESVVVSSMLANVGTAKLEARASRDADFAQMLKDTAAEAFVAEKAKYAEAAPAVPAEQTPTDADPLAGIKPAVAVVAAPATPTPDSIPGLDKIIAREVALATERKEVEAIKAQIAREREELKASRQSPTLDPEIARLAKTNPREALTRLGVDPEVAIQMAMAEKLGDKAPPELRQSIENARMREEIAALRSESASRQASETQNAVRRQAQDAVSTYVKGGISPDVPTVAAVAAKNPTMVQDAIFQEIATDAAARYRDEPNGEPITHEEAARRVEAKWAPFREALAPAAPASTPAVAAAPMTPAKPAAEPKVAPKPLYYGHDATRAAETSRAVAEAMTEYHRLESARTA